MPDVQSRRQSKTVTAVALGSVTASVLVIGALIVAFLAVVGSGPSLSRDDREMIRRANCTQLAANESIYSGDSAEPGVTALRLTRERMADLNCPESQ